MWKQGLICLTVLACASLAFADLTNRGVTVKMVEAYPDAIFFVFDTPIIGAPACSNFSTSGGCLLSQSHCAPMMTIALAAKLSGKTVEFEAAPNCVNNGTITEIKRLRIQ